MSDGAAPARILALCGGVGGAKLAHGLARCLAPDDLTIVVNTGDDFEHLGLPVSPDLDTVLYTLGGVANKQFGWGREDESWACFDELGRLGGASWFQLGDRDIALHLFRRQMRDEGRSLSEITAMLAKRFGIGPQIVPMSDSPVRTMITTEEGVLGFQHYFVGRKCEPRVKAIDFVGSESAAPAPGLTAALSDPNLRAVILCPSNPFLSIDPILALPGVRTALAEVAAPVIAVTPLIGEKAVKGPTAKICAELDVPTNPMAIAAHYKDFLDGFVLDSRDADLVAQFPSPLAVHVTDTLMVDTGHRENLARDTLNFAQSLWAMKRGSAS